MNKEISPKNADGIPPSLEAIVIPDGYISDYIDGKFRKDTPEEYIRQNIEKRLVIEHKYKREQISIEFSLKLGSGRKRADVVVFPAGLKNIQENIKIIIECKNEKTDPMNKKEGIEQLKSYMSSCLNCEWGMWTNGKAKHVFRKVKSADGRMVWDEPNDIPSRDGSIEELDRPDRSTLKLATEDNLLFAFKACHDQIYVTDGMQKQPAFFELLKVIFCKILDERNIPYPLEFFASSRERSSPDGQLTVQKRIAKIFGKVKQRYPTIFNKTDEIQLKPRSLAYVVSELQKYSFLDTYIDVKGKAYEELVGANLRGDRGEFFTPRNIVKMAIKMLDIGIDSSVLDPACGTGGFLVIAMNNAISRLQNEMETSTGKPRTDWTGQQHENVRERIKEIARRQFFGFDINPDLVKATKMNMVMNNDGSGNIIQTDSLAPPHEWSKELKDGLCKLFDLPEGSIRKAIDIALFDVVVTNPPFGTKLPIKDSTILEQYDLGHTWRETEDGALYKTENLVSSRAPEVLFVERCWQFLKPGGHMAIVLPRGILSAPGMGYASVREWIIQYNRVVACVDLHPDTFQPHNGTQTSVLFLQKKTQKELDSEIKTRKMKIYNIFFSIADKIGHDKRGNTLFRRDKEGNELLVPETNGLLIDQISDGTITYSNLPKKKLIDDQTDAIADAFLQWKKIEGIEW
ncbi:MAG: N-6 DNA Methylase [Methanosaeta sp. PtaU1.Bin060]|nr:MAG: N-6 DNA Methylase [Methanosaeta sp. PtaU1.Bin060]